MGRNIGYFNNYSRILEDSKRIAAENGRDSSNIRIMAVTKYAAAEQIADLLAGGSVEIVGESKLQDSLKKWSSPLLREYKVKKFFIGHLQTNKAAKAVENFDCIASLDSLRLAAAIEKHAVKLGRKMPCLVQIKLTQRETQGGISPTEAGPFIDALKRDFPHIKLSGLMAIAPDTDDAELLKTCFKKAKNIFDAYFSGGDILSLGMSGDYQTAVAEGSNLPRIGSGIFK